MVSVAFLLENERAKKKKGRERERRLAHLDLLCFVADALSRFGIAKERKKPMKGEKQQTGVGPPRGSQFCLKPAIPASTQSRSQF